MTKQYVSARSSSTAQHSLASKYGRKQSKKEFSAYLASEAKTG
ncbi:hypothetical protein ACEV9R_17570 [Vibrio parahaemolyticus]